MSNLFKKKYSVLVGVMLIFLVLGVLYFFVFANKTAALGNLQIYNGTAQITRSGSAVAGTTGAQIQLHDVISVASGSRVAIVLNDGTIIRLKEGSKIEVAELTYEGEKIKDVHFKLTTGQAWSRVKTLEKSSQFEVETPAVTASVRGTTFNTTLENNHTGVFVNTHAVAVRLNKTVSTHVLTQQQILWMDNNNLKDEFAKGPTAPPDALLEDEWIRFNLAEDAKLCKQLHDIPECDESVTKNESTTPTPSEETSPTEKKSPTSAPKATDVQPSPTSAPQPSTAPTKPQPTVTPTSPKRLVPTATSTPAPTYPVIY